MNRFILLLSAMFISVCGFSQNIPLKEQAVEAFKKEHYDEAIALLEKAVKETPDDAEIWYYLGWFTHYRAYDSRPMKGYDMSVVQKIFDYLDEAIRLNPQYGDALYFYSAECGAIAERAIRNNDLEKVKYYYKKAYDKGAFPAWLIEWGKNFMNTCEKNAILFTGGDADFNICMYLQLHQNHRTDLTIVPLGLTDRPGYVKALREGVGGEFGKVNLELTDDDIMDIRPYKWETALVYIPVSQVLKNEFNLDKDFQFKWNVEPDLVEPGRVVSKGIEGEEARARTYLSPRRAMLLQIIEDNFNKRPIHFSVGADPAFLAGLQPYFQNCGLTSRLVPVKTANTEYAFDFSKLETMLTSENLKDFQSVKTLDMPRISGMVVYSYPLVFTNLANHYRLSGKNNKLKQLAELYRNQLKIGFNVEYEQMIISELEK